MGKILFITDFFRPEPGGLELVFTGLARGLARDIDVIITSDEDQYLTERGERNEFDINEKYFIRRFPIPHHFLLNRKKIRGFELFVASRLRSRTYTHLLIGNLSRSTVQAAFAAIQTGVPFSVFMNGADIKKVSSLFSRRRYRPILYHAANTFPFSRQIGHVLHRSGVELARIHTVPPAMDVRFSSKTGPLPGFVDQKVKNRYMITAVGPLLPRKGLDHIVRMFDYLKDLNDRICVVIVGSGPEFTYIRELVRARGLEDSIILTGFVPDDTVASILSKSKLFIQPGHEREDDAEGISISLMEAAWFGVPAIAGAMGGVNEIIQDGKSGIIIKAGNAFELADRVRYLYANEEERQVLARGARSIGRSEFSMSRIINLVREEIAKTEIEFA